MSASKAKIYSTSSLPAAEKELSRKNKELYVWLIILSRPQWKSTIHDKKRRKKKKKKKKKEKIKKKIFLKSEMIFVQNIKINYAKWCLTIIYTKHCLTTIYLKKLSKNCTLNTNSQHISDHYERIHRTIRDQKKIGLIFITNVCKRFFCNFFNDFFYKGNPL